MKTIEHLQDPIYLSGPISSKPRESAYNFLLLETYIEEAYNGLEVINPRREEVPKGTDGAKIWEVMMRKSLNSFLRCNSVVFLQDWTTSRGALFEYMLAKHLNIPCYYYYEHDKTIGPLEFVSVPTMITQLNQLIVNKCF